MEAAYHCAAVIEKIVLSSVIKKRFYTFMKNREIAALLGLPLGTVLSKYHRAMKKLRATAEKEDIFHEKHK